MGNNETQKAKDSRAERVAAAMLDADSASQMLGMQIREIRFGFAVVTMKIRQDMVNGHGIAHGGLMFTLADSAFAFACNSNNQVTVAQQNQITFVSPGKLGETLTATAVEVSKAGRSGTYDVTVNGEDGRVVALMRGLSRTISGHTISEEAS